MCVCALISLVYIFGVNSKQNFCISLQPSTVNTAESCAVASAALLQYANENVVREEGRGVERLGETEAYKVL